MNGSPPSNWWTVAPWLRSSMMRLRNFTMSENPTSSSREARRSTVGEVVTVWIVPSGLCAGQRIIAWRTDAVQRAKKCRALLFDSSLRISAFLCDSALREAQNQINRRDAEDRRGTQRGD